MSTKPKILFWLNAFFLHFSLAYYLQSKLDADFYGIIDINTKPKKFFQDQSLVDFKKVWFYHDHIKKSIQNQDLSYLANFEKKYRINLWKLALNERFFYLHNRFYKFTKEEILSILECEARLFESILDEIKPDFLLTYDPVFHHQKLLLDLCRARGVKVLSTIIASGIENKTIIVENGATYDLDPGSSIANSVNSKNTIREADNYDTVIKNYLNNRNIGFTDKIIALKKYAMSFDSDLINTNFMYFGRSKFKVIRDSLALEIKRVNNYRFLQKVTTRTPDLNSHYVYFPMSIEEEMNLLHYAPYYTNQLEVILHVAKSIPINYYLYVKDHVAARLRGWHNKDYYGRILELQNVVFIHPHYDNNTLIKNSKLVVTIRGYSSLKAMKYGKPAIIFGDQPFSIMPSIFKVETLSELPKLVRTALNHKVDSSDYDRYVDLLRDRLFEFNMFEYENRRDRTFFAGGILSNVTIKDSIMKDFLEKNNDMFSGILVEHLNIIQKSTKPLK